jgi:flagellar FliJ protein
MSWRQSLIRISTYEVETLQKRLAEIIDRRVEAEGRIARLAEQTRREIEHARQNPEAGMRLNAYLAGVKAKCALIEAEIAQINLEEAGARDALNEAFESLKKFEQVAEWAKVAEAKEEGRREAAALDELGLRAAVRSAG